MSPLKPAQPLGPASGSCTPPWWISTTTASAPAAESDKMCEPWFLRIVDAVPALSAAMTPTWTWPLEFLTW